VQAGGDFSVVACWGAAGGIGDVVVGVACTDGVEGYVHRKRCSKCGGAVVFSFLYRWCGDVESARLNAVFCGW